MPPEPTAHVIKGRAGRGVAGQSAAHSLVDRVAPTVDGQAGARQQRSLATFCLPTTHRATAALNACGIERQLADFATETEGAGHRSAIDDEPAADTDLARYEEEVVYPCAGAAAMLGECTQVRFVRDEHAGGRPESVLDQLRQRDL